MLEMKWSVGLRLFAAGPGSATLLRQDVRVRLITVRSEVTSESLILRPYSLICSTDRHGDPGPDNWQGGGRGGGGACCE